MHVIRYLRDVLAPSRHCSILIETPLVGNADWENDLSIASMGLTTNSDLYILKIVKNLHLCHLNFLYWYLICRLLFYTLRGKNIDKIEYRILLSVVHNFLH
jgi:hypothetical protein